MYHFKIVRHPIGDETEFEQEITALLNDGWGTFSRFIILENSYLIAMFKDDDPPANPTQQFFNAGSGNAPPGSVH